MSRIDWRGPLTLLLCGAIAELVLGRVQPQDRTGSWFRYSPSGLVVNKSAGQSGHQPGPRVVRYRFGAPALRDPPAGEAARNTILVLGDSFTFGWLLAAEDTYVAQLQRLSDAEFGPRTFGYLNAASGGWGAASYVAFVEEYGDAIDPDIVLVFLNTDDVGRALKSDLYSFDESTGASLERRSRPVSRVKQLLNVLPGYEWALENLHFAQLVRRAPRDRPPIRRRPWR